MPYSSTSPTAWGCMQATSGALGWPFYYITPWLQSPHHTPHSAGASRSGKSTLCIWAHSPSPVKYLSDVGVCIGLGQGVWRKVVQECPCGASLQRQFPSSLQGWRSGTKVCHCKGQGMNKPLYVCLGVQRYNGTMEYRYKYLLSCSILNCHLRLHCMYFPFLVISSFELPAGFFSNLPFL